MNALKDLTGVLTEPVEPISVARLGRRHVTGDGMAMRAVGEESMVVFDPVGRVLEAQRLAARRKLHGDRLIHLRERRQITLGEMRAGREIQMLEMYFDGAGCPVVRSQFSERLAATTGRTAEDLWLELLEAEHTRYLPWHDWAKAFPVKPVATMEVMTRFIVCQGLGVRQVAIQLGMDQRRVLALLRRSLHRYAVLGGWQQGEHPPSANRC